MAFVVPCCSPCPAPLAFVIYLFFVVAILLRDTLRIHSLLSRHSLPLELRIFIRKNIVQQNLKICRTTRASFFSNLAFLQKGKKEKRRTTHHSFSLPSPSSSSKNNNKTRSTTIATIITIIIISPLRYR